MVSRASIGLLAAIAWWGVCALAPGAVRADTFDAGGAALGDQRLAKPLTLDLTQEPVSGLPPHPQGGSTELQRGMRLTKRWPAEVLAALPQSRAALRRCRRQDDPRPSLRRVSL